MSDFKSAYNKKHYEWHICVKNKLFWALFRVFISCFKHLQQKTKALLWVNFGSYLKVAKATAQWLFLFPFYFSNSFVTVLFLKQSYSLFRFFDTIFQYGATLFTIAKSRNRDLRFRLSKTTLYRLFLSSNIDNDLIQCHDSNQCLLVLLVEH